MAPKVLRSRVVVGDTALVGVTLAYEGSTLHANLKYRVVGTDDEIYESKVIGKAVPAESLAVCVSLINQMLAEARTAEGL